MEVVCVSSGMTNNQNPTRFAVPKGSLWSQTETILRGAWTDVRVGERSYTVRLPDPSIATKQLRPQEIPMLVERGSYDIGITGADWVAESGADIHKMLSLGYGRIKLVSAMASDSKFDTLDGLVAGGPTRINTEYLGLAQKHVMGLPSYHKLYGDAPPTVVTPWKTWGANPDVEITLSFGATEAKVPSEADCIIDVTETGSTIRGNGLKICDEIMESEAVLVCNTGACDHPKVREIAALLGGVVLARKYLHIMFNIPKTNSGNLGRIQAMSSPTVSDLVGGDKMAVSTMVLRSAYHEVLPRIAEIGGTDIVVNEPRQVITNG